MGRIFRRITYVFKPDEFQERKHEGVKIEEHVGHVLEDLQMEPGTATEGGLTKSIAEHLRTEHRSMVGATEDPVRGWTWDVCTQYYALPDPERLQGLIELGVPDARRGRNSLESQSPVPVGRRKS